MRLKIILPLLFCVIQSGHAQITKLPDPAIQAGSVRVSVTIINPPSAAFQLRFIINKPVTAEWAIIEPYLNDHGEFIFDIPLESSPNIVGLNLQTSGGFIQAFCVGIVSGEEIRIDLTFDEQGNPVIHSTGEMAFSSDDAIKTIKFSRELEMLSTPKDILPRQAAKSPEEFAQRALIGLNYKLGVIADSEEAPIIMKNYLSNDSKLTTLSWRLLDYQLMSQLDYLNLTPEEEKAQKGYVAPPDPDISYYGFLKQFNLNDPQYLYIGFLYYEIIEKLLTNKTLNIPPIGETPIEEWLEGVKTTMSDLLGFDSGLFYDLMVSNSYAMQFNNQLEPLSKNQIANIKAYFCDGEIEKILLHRNEEIKKLAAQKSELVINKTPAVAKEQLMDAIVAKYKGKVVVLDFWATWCAPCLESMKTILPLKSDLKGRDVVFVYITNSSSPKELWDEKIKGIGSEHYYLNDEEWMYLMDDFGFEGIPFYAIYDTKGSLKHKVTGYPGNDNMQTMIEVLLPPK